MIPRSLRSLARSCRGYAFGLLLSGLSFADANPWPDDWFLYTSDFETLKINRITSDGTITEYASGLNAADGMCFDNQGYLYVAGASSIFRVAPTPDGTPATLANGYVTEFITGVSNPRSVIRDLNGNFWVTEYQTRDAGGNLAPGGLYRFDANGQNRTTIDAPLINPYGLTLAPNGNICLARLGGNSGDLKQSAALLEYTPDGTPLPEPRVTGVRWLRNAVFDSTGVLYLSGGDGLFKQASPGAPLETVILWDEAKAADGYEVVHSVGLAVDPGDRLYSSSWRIASDSSTPGRIFRHDVGLPRSVLAEVGKKPFFMVFHHEPSPVSYADFVAANFTEVEVANGEADLLHDYLGQGVTNLEAYARGINPKRPIPDDWIQVHLEGDQATFIVDHIANATDLNVQFQFSSDLVNWRNETAEISPFNGMLRATLTLDATPPGKFVRVEVTQP